MRSLFLISLSLAAAPALAKPGTAPPLPPQLSVPADILSDDVVVTAAPAISAVVRSREPDLGPLTGGLITGAKPQPAPPAAVALRAMHSEARTVD